jgi:hypothetical protein
MTMMHRTNASLHLQLHWDSWDIERLDRFGFIWSDNAVEW